MPGPGPGPVTFARHAARDLLRVDHDHERSTIKPRPMARQWNKAEYFQTLSNGHRPTVTMQATGTLRRTIVARDRRMPATGRESSTDARAVALAVMGLLQ